LFIKVFLSLLIFAGLAFGVSFEYISKQPRSIEKDFYIYLYLQKNPSLVEARKLFSQVKRFNGKLKKSFKSYGLESKKAKSKFVKPKMSEDFNSMVALPPQKFLEIFNQLSSWHIKKYLNHPISKVYMQKLSFYEGFDKFASKILAIKNSTSLKSSLNLVKSSVTKSETSFYLALLNLKNGNKDIAIYYLKQARIKSVSKFKKDRATFWLYLVSKDKSYLKKVASSYEANIYSLYACEAQGIMLKNIVSKLETSKKEILFNYQDPFDWIRTKAKLKGKKASYIKKTLNAYESMPHLAYLLDGDLNNYFIFPYYTYISGYSKKRQALMLAIARQESRFIPTAVSPSFALGIMQFMPFLAKYTAKKLGMSDFRYTDMFNPKTAYLFANDHLDFLEKHLFHPLLVAYAYNGGIGYTKRDIIQSNKYFKSGEYEPWLSMELITPQEPMHYAKKVLANYVIYSNLLGLNLTLTHELERLKLFRHNHDF